MSTIIYIPLVIVTSLSLGTCVQSNSLSNQEYANHISENFQIVVPENEGKYWFIQKYGWQPMDDLVSFADTNGLDIHYHTLLWWYDLPENPCDWIIKVMQRYPEIVDWDVVNEAWNGYGATSGLDVTGAYLCAREVNETATLWYNGILDSENEQNNALELLSSGLIDGIGIQMHLRTDSNLAVYTDFIENIEDVGGLWRISELDVRLQLPPTQEDLDIQEVLYREVSELCHNSFHCTDITIWGADDGHSWIGYQWPGWGMATPFYETYQSKSMWKELNR